MKKLSTKLNDYARRAERRAITAKLLEHRERARGYRRAARLLRGRNLL